jgi:hypothetical protein
MASSARRPTSTWAKSQSIGGKNKGSGQNNTDSCEYSRPQTQEAVYDRMIGIIGDVL